MNLTIVCEIKQNPIPIIASYCREKFKQIRHISKGSFRCTFFTSLSIKNHVSKVDLKFPLDISLILLKFFLQ